jgi:hypothetical protein
VIKRLRFADDEAWRDGVDAMLDAPHGVRPTRVAASTAIASGDDGLAPHPGAVHLGVVEAWFDDAAHLHRFESGDVDGVHGSTVVAAEAVVLRGADWLERRWQDDGPRFKHMALAVRADGLGAAEFSERWRDHAGRARSSTGGPADIPDDVRGLAYVQNHPLPDDRSPYDAVNEVYFDDLDGLRRRVEWFRENAIGQVPDDLFGSTSFMAVREDVIAGRRS